MIPALAVRPRVLNPRSVFRRCDYSMGVDPAYGMSEFQSMQRFFKALRRLAEEVCSIWDKTFQSTQRFLGAATTLKPWVSILAIKFQSTQRFLGAATVHLCIAHSEHLLPISRVPSNFPLSH
jgi:hypothetical protein